jgi:glyoxylate/hydroxypyruvate reductase A
MGARLATWVVWGVINHQRKMDAYLAAQRARRWDLGIEDKGSSLLDNHNLAVGILGFGVWQQLGCMVMVDAADAAGAGAADGARPCTASYIKHSTGRLLQGAATTVGGAIMSGMSYQACELYSGPSYVDAVPSTSL